MYTRNLILRYFIKILSLMNSLEKISIIYVKFGILSEWKYLEKLF